VPYLRLKGFREDLLDRGVEVFDGPFVYALVEDGAAAVKIGRSDHHPEQRRSELQVGNPRLLRLLAYDVTLTEKPG
jgi:hypothetical protein